MHLSFGHTRGHGLGLSLVSSLRLLQPSECSRFMYSLGKYQLGHSIPCTRPSPASSLCQLSTPRLWLYFWEYHLEPKLFILRFKLRRNEMNMQGITLPLGDFQLTPRIYLIQYCMSKNNSAECLLGSHCPIFHGNVIHHQS